MLSCLVNLPSHARRTSQSRHSDEIRIGANPFQFLVSPSRALGSLFSLLAARAFHNSFSFIGFRTLSKNSRVSPKCCVQFLNFYLKESVIIYPLSFHALAHSFAPAKKPTPLFPNNCALFAKNHPGGGPPSFHPGSKGTLSLPTLTRPSASRAAFFHRTRIPGHGVTPVPVAALSPECYDLVFHDPC
jgi:hypothetical protein